jgi:hypothetical protein
LLPEKEHNAADNTHEQTNQNDDKSQHKDEVKTAYEWAYSQDVTTMPTLEEAMPD